MSSPVAVAEDRPRGIQAKFLQVIRAFDERVGSARKLLQGHTWWGSDARWGGGGLDATLADASSSSQTNGRHERTCIYEQAIFPQVRRELSQR
jgi:hypothetical protein